MKKIIGLLLSLVLCGCASVKNHWPDARTWRTSAVSAAEHPGTWVPLVGAGVIAAGGWDHEISDWAREQTPVFGSAERASDASSVARRAAYVGMLASAAAVHDAEDYWRPLTGRLAAEHAGWFAATAIVEPMKSAAGRERPSGEPGSFPSSHSTTAFAAAGMTYRNVEELGLDPVWEYGAKSLSAGAGVVTSWARVEAGKHYPTDVLGGAALGNFVALLFHDAFLGKDFPLGVEADGAGQVALTLRFSF